MEKIALTGANGFLGWHTRCAARSRGLESASFVVGDSFDPVLAAAAVSGAARFVHIAGVNRASDEEIHKRNVQFAEQAAEAARLADTPPEVIVFANSIQAGNDSAYGTSKSVASEILRAAADRLGVKYVDVELPNLFGEHGKPFYNSVVATFCHQLAAGDAPVIARDKELSLLHVQNAAEGLLGLSGSVGGGPVQMSVEKLLQRLETFREQYSAGDIPDVSSTFDRDLFNTYRSFTFPTRPAIELTRHADDRGSFFEIVRSYGGEGQSSFSTTVPGIARGDHFHVRKVERFTVLSGEATISLRKLFTTDVLEIPVTGRSPMAIDMPTLWAHKIVNTGNSELYTSFWTNEIFDPIHPDTFAEAV